MKTSEKFVKRQHYPKMRVEGWSWVLYCPLFIALPNCVVLCCVVLCCVCKSLQNMFVLGFVGVAVVLDNKQRCHICRRTKYHHVLEDKFGSANRTRNKMRVAIESGKGVKVKVVKLC